MTSGTREFNFKGEDPTRKKLELWSLDDLSALIMKKKRQISGLHVTSEAEVSKSTNTVLQFSMTEKYLMKEIAN
jgi:hypothetical protein